MTAPSETKGGSKPSRTERTARLEAELRANLKRRKELARARAARTAGGGAEEAPPVDERDGD